MDPMESMSVSGGNVPANFNAEDAGNMEDVRRSHTQMSHSRQFVSQLADSIRRGI